MPARDALFVGRERELEALREVFAASVSGTPALAAVVAHVGGGKSRLVDEFLGTVDRRRALVLTGGASPDRSRPLMALTSVLEEALADPWCAQLPEASPVMAALRSPGPDDAPRRRFGGDGVDLGVDAGRLVLAVAARRPLVVVVEDLHWTDAASLNALTDVGTAARDRSRRGQPTRLVIVVTRRPVPDDDALVPLLDRLERAIPSSIRLDLPALGHLEVNELVRHAIPGPVSGRLLGEVMEATGGNPLLVHEAVAQLTARQNERGPRRAAHLDLRGIADVASAVRSRLDVLEVPDRRLLGRAALLSEPFDTALLARLDGSDRDTVEDALERAWAARIVAADDRGYRFVHPSVPEALLVSMSPARRASMHAGIAAAMAADPLAANPSVVSEHLLRAGAQAAPELVRAYVPHAAEHAFQLGAYTSSAQLAELALEATPETDSIARARLHHRAGEASLRADDPGGGRRHLERARDLAAGAGDYELAGTAVEAEVRAFLTYEPHYAALTEVEAFLASADALSPGRRAHIVEALSELTTTMGQLDRGLSLGEQALRLADAGDDDVARAKSHFAIGLAHFIRLELEAAEADFRTSYHFARLARDPWHALWGAGRLALVVWMQGRLDDAAVAAQSDADQAAEHHNWSEASIGHAVLAGVALTHGDVETCERHADHAVQLVRRSDYVWSPRIVFPVLAAARALRGDRTGAHGALDEWEQISRRASTTRRVYVDVVTGSDASAHLIDPARLWRGQPNVLSLGSMLAMVDVAVSIGQNGLAASAVAPLESLVEQGVAFPCDGHQFLGRALADACTASGRPHDAAAHLRLAIGACGRAGARLELGFAHLGFGRLAATDEGADYRDEAHGEVEAAVRIFEDLDLPAAVRTAERVGERIGRRSRRRSAPRTSDATPVVRTLLITDIVSSTTMTRHLGDEEWVVLLGQHDELLRGCINAHGGTEFAHTGDGLGAWFAGPEQALACAFDIHDSLCRFNQSRADHLRVRIGVCSGEPIARGVDLSGLVVSRVHRVMQWAGAGEVAVGEELATGATESLAMFKDLGPKELRGFAQAQHVYLAIAR
jgi:class 3 adenylate cyclase